jgi:uncharacterized protein with PQ loop repeat
MSEKFAVKPKKEVRDEKIGYIAAALGIMAYVPLVYQVAFKKATHSLHYLWMIIGAVSSVLWMIYGVKNKLLPNIYGSAVVLTILLFLAITKIYYETTGQASHQPGQFLTPGITV